MFEGVFCLACLLALFFFVMWRTQYTDSEYWRAETMRYQKLVDDLLKENECLWELIEEDAQDRPPPHPVEEDDPADWWKK